MSKIKSPIFKILLFLFIAYCCAMTITMCFVVIIKVESKLDWGVFFKWVLPPCVVVSSLIANYAANKLKPKI